MNLEKSEWINLKEGKSMMFVLKDLKMKVNRFEGEVCK